MILEIEKLSKKYGDVEIIKDLNLHIKKGEFISIVGPSGCGKSTLFKIITGLLTEYTGRVRIDGSMVKNKVISYLPQKDLLLPWKTLYENAAIPLEISGVKKERWKEIITPLMEEFGLSGFENRYPHELSGGMRQRGGLLRSFLIDSDLMLLDEPFGALDALTRSSMQDWLLEIWKKHNHSILFITHDIEEAVYLSDRVYIMSARPGRFLDELEIKFPRPRKKEVILSQDFLEYKGRILEKLK
ncbi:MULTISPECIES: ABC transporter ATP-binding protein [Psychrilyobacter]|uniref:ATP-binding cassette domain-containing protein n=1 Tax=Psychrilyobacter piezotolerans TaxID=2293438 RepID=A0ABX9KL47_9FUSO|nr:MULTISPECIES: ABC transporter ATP-binding protein [Psychrilyobacter]MCS5422489.1 ABC transporter ATP-binding protein [Psychrilyobacter sp. S5]NDI76867.1 ABC transporter ATP-binding protein [Psychrilyobacter piezotolerans]RDE65146.1 ABC transporter ATP-binding protein [Psychrilyobacter sp. S5]REI42716.1 ATP-binding cassette domain-containing protein [Psychrilyobacter piezotolerans]